MRTQQEGSQQTSRGTHSSDEHIPAIKIKIFKTDCCLQSPARRKTTANILLLTAGCLMMMVSLALSETYTSNEYQERLGVAYEFKIHIDPGKEECFFQNVQANSSLYVAFQVLRGGDQQAGFAVKDPIGNIVLPYSWKASDELEQAAVPVGGYYQFCIDNSLSHFAAKVVSMYVAAFKRHEWENYINDISEAEASVDILTRTMEAVDTYIGNMLKFLDQSRRSVTHDWYLVEGNNKYIAYWSAAQCFVIIVSAVVQVWFYRKMFDDALGYGTSRGGGVKTRA